MPVIEVTDAKKREEACRALIKSLPDWFGLPRVNIQYIKEAGNYKAIGYKCDDDIVGMIVIKSDYDEDQTQDVFNIHWMGIDPDYHRQGIGKKLVAALCAKAREAGVETVTVETLNPKALMISLSII